MKLSKELLEKAKTATSVEELLEKASAEGVELSAGQAAKAFSELHKMGELSDEELDNVSGGGCKDSGDTPKFSVGQNVYEYANRGSYPVTVTYVSSEKTDCGGIITSNVFTYSVQPKGGELETDVPEFNLHL